MSDPPLCVSCRRRPADPDWRPFCSKRCRMADLGRWLSGDYRVPGASADESSERAGTRDQDDDSSVDR